MGRKGKMWWRSSRDPTAAAGSDAMVASGTFVSVTVRYETRTAALEPSVVPTWSQAPRLPQRVPITSPQLKAYFSRPGLQDLNLRPAHLLPPKRLLTPR